MEAQQRKPRFRYRICRKCGEEWNVSKKDTYPLYVCPKCEYKERKIKNEQIRINAKIRENFH